MKTKIIIIISIVVAAIATIAYGITVSTTEIEASEKGIKYFDGSFDQALAKAKEENKMVFVKAYANWCGTCRKLESKEMSKEVTGSYYNATFINYKLNVDVDKIVAATYEIQELPTLLYLDNNGVVLKKLVGYRAADDLVKIGKIMSEK
jgi:thioredoxin 1